MAESERVPIVGSVVLLGGIVAVAVFLLMFRASGDVGHGRDVFEGLAGGRASVSGAIDWTRLQALDINIGATYTQLKDDAERARYRTAFLTSFSQAFARIGGTASAFRGWRLASHKPGRLIIAADYPAKHKTILLGFADSGEKPLVSIQWQK